MAEPTRLQESKLTPFTNPTSLNNKVGMIRILVGIRQGLLKAKLSRFFK
jgi:hypothetical protein